MSDEDKNAAVLKKCISTRKGHRAFATKKIKDALLLCSKDDCTDAEQSKLAGYELCLLSKLETLTVLDEEIVGLIEDGDELLNCDWFCLVGHAFGLSTKVGVS